MPDYGYSKDSLRGIVGLTGEFVGTTDSQELTNKTLTSAIINSPTIATPTFSAPLSVANGGSGAGTLTGVLIGNGTSAFTVKTNPSGDFVDNSSAQTITGAKTFASQAFILRNPANTQSLTFINPAITAGTTAQFMDPHSYLVYKDGSNFVAKRDNWALESSNSDALTVLQYAVNQTHTNSLSPILIKAGTTYPLTGSLVIADKNVFLIGLNNDSSTGIGATIEKNFATTAPLIDMTNTSFRKNRVQNLYLKGNSTAGDIGLKGYFLREGEAIKGISATLFGTGIELSSCTHIDLWDIQCFSNLTYGIKMVGGSSAKVNTTRFHGGRSNSNPTNLHIAASTGNHIHFFGTEFEGANASYVHAVEIESGSNYITFDGSSFEKNQETNPVAVYDNGNNNTYINCRFDSDVDYTPINVRSSAKNIAFIRNEFQTNTSSTTQTILIDSGALNTIFIANQKGTNTVATVSLTDNGSNTLKIGCAQMGTGWNDRLPAGLEFGPNGVRLLEASSTIVKLRDSGDTAYRNLLANSVGISQLRTTGSANLMTLTTNLIENLVANQFNLQNDHTIITIPSDPSAGFVRNYAKAVDANNDGFFYKTKVNGAVVEVAI